MTDLSKSGDAGAGTKTETTADVKVEVVASASPPEDAGVAADVQAQADMKAPRRRKPNKAKQGAAPEPEMPLHFADCSPAWRAFYEHLAKEV